MSIVHEKSDLSDAPRFLLTDALHWDASLQSASCSGRKSERLNQSPENEPTIGQRLYTLTREALQNLLELTQNLFAQGKSTEQVLEVIMPS